MNSGPPVLEGVTYKPESPGACRSAGGRRRKNSWRRALTRRPGVHGCSSSFPCALPAPSQCVAPAAAPLPLPPLVLLPGPCLERRCDAPGMCAPPSVQGRGSARARRASSTCMAPSCRCVRCRVLFRVESFALREAVGVSCSCLACLAHAPPGALLACRAARSSAGRTCTRGRATTALRCSTPTKSRAQSSCQSAASPTAATPSAAVRAAQRRARRRRACCIGGGGGGCWPGLPPRSAAACLPPPRKS